MIRKFILIAVAVMLSPIAAHFSTRVVMSEDSSQEATVGIISREGFPIWFVESAPGCSIYYGWHQARCYADIAVWAVVLVLLGLAVNRIIGKRGAW